jgi:hypothetical protein
MPSNNQTLINDIVSPRWSTTRSTTRKQHQSITLRENNPLQLGAIQEHQLFDETECRSVQKLRINNAYIWCTVRSPVITVYHCFCTRHVTTAVHMTPQYEKSQCWFCIAEKLHYLQGRSGSMARSIDSISIKSSLSETGTPRQTQRRSLSSQKQ